jgi:uncharacterized protein YcbX
MADLGTVAALYRYPVKSMLGERLQSAELTERGIAGDRGWAVLDRSDGRIANGKHPRKWGRLLELAAAYVDGPGSPVAITFPDGTTIRSDGAIDAALATYLGRDVTLVDRAEEGQLYEGLWFRMEGYPIDLLESMSGGREEDGMVLTDMPLSFLSPPGTLFDATTLHVITTSTLRHLSELAPDADFDVRRYRPNVLVDDAGEGFVENDWVGSTLSLGGVAAARVDMPTMRCTMTTVARDGMAQDRAQLQAIAKHNRLEIAGMGTWACAGIYATITAEGHVAVGDAVRS